MPIANLHLGFGITSFYHRFHLSITRVPFIIQCFYQITAAILLLPLLLQLLPGHLNPHLDGDGSIPTIDYQVS